MFKKIKTYRVDACWHRKSVRHVNGKHQFVNDPPDYARFGENTPLGRPGQPAEVASAFVSVAHNDATYIAGATLPVGGRRITI